MKYIDFEEVSGCKFFVRKDLIIGFSEGISEEDSYIYLSAPIGLGTYESKAINVKGTLSTITDRISGNNTEYFA